MWLSQVLADPNETAVCGDEAAFFAALETGELAAIYDRLLMEQQARLAWHGEPVVAPGLDASEE